MSLYIITTCQTKLLPKKAQYSLLISGYYSVTFLALNRDYLQSSIPKLMAKPSGKTLQ